MFEWPDVFNRREQELQQRRQAAPVAAVRPSPLAQTPQAQQARGAYQAQQQAAAAPPGPFDGLGGFVSGALDLLGRPGQAVRTGTSQAIEANRAGLGVPEVLGAFGQGAAQGIQGQGPASFAEVFQHQLNAPAGPQLGPWDTRGVAGFGMDLLTDPLGMIPGSRLSQIPGKVGGVLGATSHASPYVRRGAEALDFAAEPVGRTLPRGIPGASGLANLASPRTVASADQPFLDYLSRAGQIPDRARSLAASFNARRGVFDLDEVGRVLLPDGERVAWNDLFQNPFQVSRLPLAPEQHRYIKDLQDGFEDLWLSYQKWHERLRGIAPETAASKAFAAEELALGPGDRFIAREFVLPSTGEVASVRSPRARKGFQFTREFPTAEEAVAAGYRSLDPVETFEYRIKQMGEKVNQIQYALALEPLATVRDLSRVPMAEAGIKAAQAQVTLANELRHVVARAGRGETIPTQTMEKLRESFPTQIDQLLRIQSHTVQDVPFAGLLQQGEGLTGTRAAPNQREIESLIARVSEHLQDVRQGIAGSQEVIGGLRAPASLRPGVQTAAQEAFGVGGQRQEVLELSALLGLLQRAARGESVPAATLRPFGERYSAIVEPLTRFMGHAVELPAGAVRAGPVAARTTVSRDQFIALAEQARDLYRETLGEARRAKGIRGGIDQANEAKVAGLVEGAPFPGMFFTAEAAERIAANFARTANPIVEGAANLTGPLRGLLTGFDLGGMFIQGVPGLARRPAEWLAAFTATARAFADPQTLPRYLADPETQRVFRELPQLATAGVGQEYFEGLTDRTRGLPRLLGQVPGVGSAVLNVMGRSQASFETGGLVLRTEWAKALLPQVQRAEAAGMPEARAQLAQFLNHATGTVNRAGQGVHPTQQAAERFFFFAPGYTASAFATLGDLFSGPVARGEAIKTIGAMLAVGAYGYTHFAQALGQEPITDPKDSRFMTVGVGGERVGIGSVWTALARTLARVAAVEDPKELLSADPSNPFVRFWRGRASPTVSLAWDLVLGENYLGQPITDNPGQFAGRLAQTVTPFSGGATVEAAGRGGPAAGATAFASQFLGLREFPGTVADRRNQVVEELFPGQSYATLDPYQRVEVQQDPRMAGQPVPEGSRFARDRELRDAFDQYSAQVNEKADAVAAGTITKTQFRQVLRDIQAERSVRLEDLGEDPNRKPPSFEAARHRAEYFAKFKEQDVLGDPDFAAAEEFLSSLPAASRQYIEDVERAAFRRLSPGAEQLMNELKDARAKTKDYWQAKDRGLERYRIDDEWEAASPAERQAIANDRRHPLRARYLAANRLTEQLRERMRQRDRTLDRTLAEWYGRTAIADRAPTGGGEESGGFGSGFGSGFGQGFGQGFGSGFGRF